MSTLVVGIATSADGPPRSQGKVVELDRFSVKVALETPEPALCEGASVWLHFNPPGGSRPLSLAGIVSGAAPRGQITVLLSLSPKEYSLLRGLPEPPVQRGGRAVRPPPMPPGIKPIQPREVPEPRPEPERPRPTQPAEAPAAVQPDVAGLSPMERARALAAALAEMVGPSAEPAASPKPSEPAEAPVAIVEPQPEPVPPSPVAAVDAPAAVEPGVEPAWLQPVEEAAAPIEIVEPLPEPPSVTLAESAEAPVAVAPTEPEPEPVTPVPVEVVDAPVAVEPSVEPARLEPVEEAAVPVKAVESRPVPPAPPSLSPGKQAEALAARGDYEGAWKVYYEALRVTPDDLSLWYGLGLTLSRLNRRKEAEEIFQYVVSCGDPGSEQVKHARQWLAGAGPVAQPAAPVVSATRRSETKWALIKGRVTWGEAEAPHQVFLVLQGLDKDGPRAHSHVRLGQFYKFDRLPPGSYHLIGGVEEEWLWDFTFTVEAGQEVGLDLSRDNSTNPTAQV